MTGPVDVTPTIDPRASGRESILSWSFTILAVAYASWTWFAVAHWTTSFQVVFEDLGAALPFVTVAVVNSQAWLFPAFFGLAIAGLLVKEFVTKDKRWSVALTFVILAVVMGAREVIQFALLQPLVVLINSMK